MATYSYVGYIEDSIEVQKAKEGIEKLVGSDAQVQHFEFDEGDAERYCYLSVDAGTSDQGRKHLLDNLKLGQYLSSLFYKPDAEPT